MNTSEVLYRAADLIEERGWVKGQGWPGQGDYGLKTPTGLCLEGGIMAALGVTMRDDAFDTLSTCPAYRAVHAHLNLAYSRLFNWNDKPQRTAAEVIEVLRAAAVIEAAREEQDAAWETYPELVSS